MKRTVWLLVAIGMVALQSLPAAGLTSGNLPGGTPIEVDNTSPTDGDTLLIPLGSATADIVDQGIARVGSGAIVKDTTVVYIMDVSGSMNSSSGVDCDGIPGFDTRLDCEKAGVAAANAAARQPDSEPIWENPTVRGCAAAARGHRVTAVIRKMDFNDMVFLPRHHKIYTVILN